MSISEIGCYHNGCPKRKFFNSLPVDHIFIYATLGPAEILYTATGYCILRENHTLAPSSIRNKFNEIEPELSPIRVFLQGEEEPRLYRSLNVLAFKYEVEMENGEEKEIRSSFYLALRKKCGFGYKNICEIKVFKKDEEKTKETAFLESLDVKFIKKAIEQLKSINVEFIEEAIEQSKSTNVYEKIYSNKDVTEEYEEEKTPRNKINRIRKLRHLTFNQYEQKQDLEHFFRAFLPFDLLGPLEEEFEKIKLEDKDPEKEREERYKRISEEGRLIMSTIKGKDKEDCLDIFANVESAHENYWRWMKRFGRKPEDSSIQSTLTNAQVDLDRALLEAEDFLRESREENR